MINYCPKLQTISNFHEFDDKLFIKKTKEYEEKFFQILNFVEKNKKFPDFEEIDEKITNFSCWLKVMRRRCFYEKNFAIFKQAYQQMMKRKKELRKDKLIQKYYVKCIACLNYQKENLVLPSWAKWFNNNSEVIFEYLEKFK